MGAPLLKRRSQEGVENAEHTEITEIAEKLESINHPPRVLLFPRVPRFQLVDLLILL